MLYVYPTEGMNLIIRGLTKTYAHKYRALNNINIELTTGMTGILGPNGAGKTTFMKIIATLLLPSSGRVVFDEINIVKHPMRLRALLGYLPQDFHPYADLTVEEFLSYCAHLSKLDRHTYRVDEALEKVRLGEKRRTRTKHLSGGMIRRLGIAQALLNDPKLLIVDEPTAGLDPAERIRFRTLLASLSGERIVLLSTHIVEDIASTCSQVVVMNKGSVLLQASPAELAYKAYGTVWEMHASRKELASLQKEYLIMRTILTDTGWNVRLIANRQPHERAAPSMPGIEDGYMSLIPVSY